MKRNYLTKYTKLCNNETKLLNDETKILKKSYAKLLNKYMEIDSLFICSRKRTLHCSSVIWSLYRSLLICGFAPSVIIISNHALSALLFCIVNKFWDDLRFSLNWITSPLFIPKINKIWNIEKQFCNDIL